MDPPEHNRTPVDPLNTIAQINQVQTVHKAGFGWQTVLLSTIIVNLLTTLFLCFRLWITWNPRQFQTFATLRTNLAKFTANWAKFAQFAHPLYESREIRATHANFSRFPTPNSKTDKIRVIRTYLKFAKFRAFRSVRNYPRLKDLRESHTNCFWHTFCSQVRQIPHPAWVNPANFVTLSCISRNINFYTIFN